TTIVNTVPMGQVAVDNLVPIDFANKSALALQGLGGDDTFVLANPSQPAGLTSISIDGGTNTNGDTLVVHGLSRSLDELRYAPTGAGQGNVINDAQTQAAISFTAIEQLTLALQQTDGDGIRIDGTAGNDAIEFFTGATSGDGSFHGNMDQNNATGAGP